MRAVKSSEGPRFGMGVGERGGDQLALVHMSRMDVLKAEGTADLCHRGHADGTVPPHPGHADGTPLFLSQPFPAFSSTLRALPKQRDCSVNGRGEGEKYADQASQAYPSSIFLELFLVGRLPFPQMPT